MQTELGNIAVSTQKLMVWFIASSDRRTIPPPIKSLDMSNFGNKMKKWRGCWKNN